MFKLIGQEPIYQWHKNRRIEITDDRVVFVDYANDGEIIATRVKVENIDGMLIANIPNDKLCVDGRLKMWFIDKEKNAFATDNLFVEAKPKDPDYVYEPTEILSYERLEERIAALEKCGPGGGITQETDPTVPEWAKQPEKPTYTADEVGALPKNTKIPTKTSELENDSAFVKNTDYATSEKAGVVTVPPAFGIQMYNGGLRINPATNSDIDSGKSSKPITPSNLTYAVLMGIMKGNEEWSNDYKVAVRDSIGASGTEPVQSDWNQNDASMLSYVKNRPFYEFLQKGEVVFASQEVALTNQMYEFNPPLSLEAGEECVIVINNVVIPVKYEEMMVLDAQYHSLVGQFLMLGTEGLYIYAPANGRFVLEVYKIENGIKTLDEKFIPDTIARQEAVSKLSEDIADLTSRMDAIIDGNEVEY